MITLLTTSLTIPPGTSLTITPTIGPSITPTTGPTGPLTTTPTTGFTGSANHAMGIDIGNDELASQQSC